MQNNFINLLAAQRSSFPKIHLLQALDIFRILANISFEKLNLLKLKCILFRDEWGSKKGKSWGWTCHFFIGVIFKTNGSCQNVMRFEFKVTWCYLMISIWLNCDAITNFHKQFFTEKKFIGKINIIINLNPYGISFLESSPCRWKMFNAMNNMENTLRQKFL